MDWDFQVNQAHKNFRNELHPYPWWPFSLNPDRRTMSDLGDPPLQLTRLDQRGTGLISNYIQQQELREENWNTNPTYWRKSMTNRNVYFTVEFNDTVEAYQGSSYSGTASLTSLAFVDCLQQPIRKTRPYCYGWADNASYRNINARRDTNFRDGNPHNLTLSQDDFGVWGRVGLQGGRDENPTTDGGSNQTRTSNWYWVTTNTSHCPGWSRARYTTIPGRPNSINAADVIPPYSHHVNWYGFIWGICGGYGSQPPPISQAALQPFREELTKGLYGADPWVDSRITSQMLYDNFIGFDKSKIYTSDPNDINAGYFVPTERSTNYRGDSRDRIYRPSNTRLVIDPEENAYYMDTRYLETVCSEMFCQYNLICKTTTAPFVIFELIVKIYGIPRKEHFTMEESESGILNRNHRVMYDFEVTTSVKPFV